MDKDTFTICSPVCAEGKLDMPMGSIWPFCLIGIDGLYFFTAQVLRVLSDQKAGYLIGCPQTFYRCQRRKDVRVSCILDVTYRVVGEGAESLERGSPNQKQYAGRYSAIVVDLSGGGLRMVTKEQVPRQARLVLISSWKVKRRQSGWKGWRLG